MVRQLVALLAVALPGATIPALAQQIEAAPRYAFHQLDCAQFQELARTAITTQSGRRSREQTAGRRGVWQFRATTGRNGIAVEGWLDTLVLWRRSPETTIRPDTDGLVGGRYRGMLSWDGIYSAAIRPFIPDEVAEVAGMGTALDDFFPRLPPHALPTGEVWSDSLGLRIQRMSDSALSGLPLYRFAVESRRESRSAPVEQDTLRLRLHQVTEERGRFVWHPTLGLLARERNIVIETSVPAGSSVREPIRSRIVQRIGVERILTAASKSCPGAGASPRPAGARP